MNEEPLTLKLRSIFDTAPGWLQEWYFELRLSEEVYRAERFNTCVTLCLIGLQPSVDVDSEEGIRFLATLEKQFRRTDLAGITKPDEIAICLIEATAEQSVLVLDRLSPQLDCHVAGHGFASFPADATTAEGLIRHARLTMAGG